MIIYKTETILIIWKSNINGHNLSQNNQRLKNISSNGQPISMNDKLHKPKIPMLDSDKIEFDSISKEFDDYNSVKASPLRKPYTVIDNSMNHNQSRNHMNKTSLGTV